MMKRRVLSVFLVLCMLCGLLPMGIPAAQAYSETDVAYPVEGGNIYFDKATGTITGCDSSVTAADIPLEIDGAAVTSICDSAFENCSSLTSVTIPEGVISIGSSAFMGCTGLARVTIPKTMKSIYGWAFQNCEALDAVLIADLDAWCQIMFESSSSNPLYYAEDLYCNGELLNDLIIPASMDFSSGAFRGWKGLKSVVLADGIIGIGDGAFAGCTGLASITIPDSVKTIGDQALKGCVGLTSITIPEGVTYIGESAFRGCTGLTSIDIPESVEFIRDSAFAECTGLTSVEIPDKDISIGAALFYGCTGLTSVVIPDSFKRIGVNMFSGCSSLTSIIIPDSVTNIDHHAFWSCTSLTSVYFMGDAPEIGDGVFCVYDMEAQTNVIIPDLMLYYIDGKEGWTTPTWNGYPTAIWSSDSHTHSYTDTVIAPTCTEQGYTIHICKCGYSCMDTYVVALGHDLGAWAQMEAPTCTEKGEEKRGCSRCDAFETREITATGHTEVIDVAVPATCTEAGKTEGKHCAVCGTVLVAEEIVPAVGHTEIVDAAVSATCTKNGLTEGKYCSVCGTVIVAQEIVSALGHDYKDGICTVCGAKDPDYKPTEPVQPVKFSDVSENAWYYDAVEYAVTNGLMNGVGKDQFDPEGTMTRAMLVTVLWRHEGEPDAPANTFSDVKAGTWYSDAVSWAAANGVVNGVGGNRFDPDGNITREQMAAILYRYCNGKGIDTSKQGSLSGFPDAGKVSSYAKRALQWTVAEGIIGGSDGKLLPQGNATRAQVATILMRFIENIA